MDANASEDYEYDYSDEDDYPVDDDMSWDATGDNPNAAPVVFATPKGTCDFRVTRPGTFSTYFYVLRLEYLEERCR